MNITCKPSRRTQGRTTVQRGFQRAIRRQSCSRQTSKHYFSSSRNPSIQHAQALCWLQLQMGYILYSLTFLTFVLFLGEYFIFARSRSRKADVHVHPKVLYLTRESWISHIPIPDYIYTRLPTSFRSDIENGFTSDDFDLQQNVNGRDQRQGLDQAAKREVGKIMKRNKVGFDEARRLYMQRRFRDEGIGEDGRPRDPKFVSFSWRACEPCSGLAAHSTTPISTLVSGSPFTIQQSLHRLLNPQSLASRSMCGSNPCSVLLRYLGTTLKQLNPQYVRQVSWSMHRADAHLSESCDRAELARPSLLYLMPLSSRSALLPPSSSPHLRACSPDYRCVASPLLPVWSHSQHLRRRQQDLLADRAMGICEPFPSLASSGRKSYFAPPISRRAKPSQVMRKRPPRLLRLRLRRNIHATKLAWRNQVWEGRKAL